MSRHSAPGLVLALLAGGCAAGGPMVLDAPRDVPAPTAGVLTDPVSGFAFPDTVAGFSRVRAARMTPQADDLAVAYDSVWPGGQIAATVYVHPSARTRTVGLSLEQVEGARDAACHELFATRTREMVDQHLGAAPPRTRPVSLMRDGQPQQGMRASSDYSATVGGSRTRVDTELEVFCDVASAWTVEYRFSYPHDSDAADRIAAFVGALDWGGLRGS